MYHLIYQTFRETSPETDHMAWVDLTENTGAWYQESIYSSDNHLVHNANLM